MKTSKRTAAVSTPAALELEDVERSDPRETIRRGARMTSRRTGIISHLGHGRYHAGDPQSFAMGIIASDLSRFSDIQNSSKGGGGGDRLEVAMAASIGEAAERYSMFFFDHDSMILAPYSEVAEHAPSPELLRLYSRQQIEGLGPKAKTRYFTDDSPVRWVWGHSLTHGEPRLIPAPLVYMDYRFGDDEHIIGRNASTGLAAGLTIEEAILTGIYEVIERDAFTFTWLRRRPGRAVEVDDPQLAELMKGRFAAEHPKVDLRVIDVTLDIDVSSFWVVMRRPAEMGDVVCVGSASRLAPREAVLKCLLESGQAIPYFRYLLTQLGDWQPADDYADVTSFDHHCVFYIKRPDLVSEAFSFLDEIEDEVALSEIPDQSTGRVLGDIERCVEILGEAGLEVIVVEITTPDILDVGMRVVRVVVPGMLPLHGVHKYPYLGVRRLYDLPARRGAAPGSAGELPINPFPHPFP